MTTRIRLMRRRGYARWIPLLVLVLACGSRSLPPEREQPVQVQPAVASAECLSDLDCLGEDLCLPATCVEQVCVSSPVLCDDQDECTEDRCVSETGECVFEPLTEDLDGDGARRPLPGFLPGEAGSCGDDCDDTRQTAFPGGQERCDGVDNDCDGVVDNGELYQAVSQEPLLLSEQVDRASVGAVAYGEQATTYATVFTSHRGRGRHNTFATVAPSGGALLTSNVVSDVNSNTFAGALIWTGRAFATAWEDRRDEDYEIYFNRLTADGDKLGPDLRITAANGFSLRPSMAFNGELVLAWEDRRGGVPGQIYAQRLTARGVKIGDNVALTPPELIATSPQLVDAGRRLGLLFHVGGAEAPGLAFMTLEADLSEPSPIVPIPFENAGGASIVPTVNGRFAVAWNVENDAEPGPRIFAAILGADGQLLAGPRAVTEGATFARHPSLLSLGDRLLLVWAQWTIDSYQLFMKELNTELESLGPRQVVAPSFAESLAPTLSFGQDEVAVVFSGRPAAEDSPQVYFSRLTCGP